MKLAFPILFLIVVTLAGWSLFAQDRIESLPVFPMGDSHKGVALFEGKLCSRCHTVQGANFPDLDLPPVDIIHLSGANHYGWTRDLFAREIINPQHLISPDHQKAMVRVGDRLGEVNSPMLNFNEKLTIRELIDIVTFLEEKASLPKP